MNDVKPTFTFMSTDAFVWFTECYYDLCNKARMFGVKIGIPTFANHFLKFYNLTDKEITDETNEQKQFELIQKKYVKDV